MHSGTLSSETPATGPRGTSRLGLGAGRMGGGSSFGLMTGDISPDLVEVWVLQEGIRFHVSLCIFSTYRFHPSTTIDHR